MATFHISVSLPYVMLHIYIYIVDDPNEGKPYEIQPGFNDVAVEHCSLANLDGAVEHCWNQAGSHQAHD